MGDEQQDLKDMLAHVRAELAAVSEELTELRADAAEREETELEARDARIRELENNLRGLADGWTVPHRGEDDPRLPIPRLDVRYYQMFEHQDEDDWRNYRKVFSLVYRSWYDELIFIPLSVVETRGHGNGDKFWERAAHPSDLLGSRLYSTALYTAAHMNLEIWVTTPDGCALKITDDGALLVNQTARGYLARRAANTHHLTRDELLSCAPGHRVWWEDPDGAGSGYLTIQTISPGSDDNTVSITETGGSTVEAYVTELFTTRPAGKEPS